MVMSVFGTSTPHSTLDVYTPFNNASSGLFSGRIYGNDSQIGETGIRICELGSTDLSGDNKYPLSVLAKMVVLRCFSTSQFKDCRHATLPKKWNFKIFLALHHIWFLINRRLLSPYFKRAVKEVDGSPQGVDYWAVSFRTDCKTWRSKLFLRVPILFLPYRNILSFNPILG